MNENPTLSIPKDVIEPIIQAHINAALATALGDKAVILEQVVAHVLNQKVDSSGKPSTSSYDKTTWIQYVMREAIKNAVKNALEIEMVKHQETVKKVIVAELTKKNSPMIKQLVLAMTGAITNPSTLKYRLTVQCADD